MSDQHDDNIRNAKGPDSRAGEWDTDKYSTDVTINPEAVRQVCDELVNAEGIKDPIGSQEEDFNAFGRYCFAEGVKHATSERDRYRELLEARVSGLEAMLTAFVKQSQYPSSLELANIAMKALYPEQYGHDITILAGRDLVHHALKQELAQHGVSPDLVRKAAAYLAGHGPA